MKDPVLNSNQTQQLPSFYKLINTDKTSKEVVVDADTIYKRKINIDDTYDYVNHQLSELCGFQEFELIGEGYKKIIHLDMPNVIYTTLNERLSKGLPIQIIEKFTTKNGISFWLLTKYQSKIDENGTIIHHTAISKKIANQTIAVIDKLYKSLKRIEEKTNNVVMSKRFLIGFLENYGHTYNSFIDEIINKLPINRFKIELVENIEKQETKSNRRIKPKLFTQAETVNRQLQLIRKGA